MARIQGYDIIEHISDTRGASIGRAKTPDGSRTVIVKTLKTSSPSPTEVARFKQEYDIIRTLDLDGVVKTFDIIIDDNLFGLVLEDFSGVPLKHMIHPNRPMAVSDFFPLAIRMARALGGLHENGIIHKAVTPAHILVNVSTGELKLTHFGICASITHENDDMYDPEVMEGTLAYMSPEQSGRMNRTVDSRADLYSLGIIFYEMLTGAVPFMSDNPLTIIHSHIAVKPLSLNERKSGLPGVLSAIVLKLLTKNPEGRYQNAFGLMEDLKECSRRWAADGTIGPFELGRKDMSGAFSIPRTLFGRDEEIARLLESFDRAAQGDNAVFLVSGKPGIGKSALIQEIQKPILAAKGYFISGKFDQFRRDEPYSAVAQAFQSLVKQFLRENETQLETWKFRLAQALGPNGKVMTDIIPELELIIGPQPELPELGLEESKHRFILAFLAFVSAISGKKHPIALFIDDLQWADFASLKLIEHMVGYPLVRHVFVIGAFRDNDPESLQPVKSSTRALENAGVTVDHIELGPLGHREIRHVVAETLKCPLDKAEPLSELIESKTGGNPFFVIQFLQTLHKEKKLVFDAKQGWVWRMDDIRAMGITENVVDLMVRKITALPGEVQSLIKICAIIGNRFDLETIAMLTRMTLDRALALMTKAVHEGLTAPEKEDYVFAHDRIQEAAYSLVSAGERETLHYRVGWLTWTHCDEKGRDEHLFFITDHLNAGSRLLTDPNERDPLIHLNVLAGKKSKASAAYAPALRYFQQALSLLGDRCWEDHYPLTLSITNDLTETAYLTGDYPLMNRIAETATAHARHILDLVTISFTRMNAAKATKNFDQAISIGLSMLDKLGIHIPSKPHQQHVLKMVIKAKWYLRRKTVEELIDLPVMTNREMLAAAHILSSLGHAAYNANPNIFAIDVLNMMPLGIKYGNAPEHPFAYAAYGAILIAGFDDIEGAYRFANMALKLVDKLRLETQKSRVSFVYNVLIRHWKEHARNSMDAFVEAFQMGLDTSDLEYAAFNLFGYHEVGFNIGLPLTALARRMDKQIAIIRLLNQDNALDQCRIFRQAVFNLMENREDPTDMNGSILNADDMIPVLKKANQRTAVFTYYYLRLYLSYLFGRHDRIMVLSEKAWDFIDAVSGTISYPCFLLYDTLAKLALYPDLHAPEQRKVLKQAWKVKKKFRKWSRHAPMNFRHRLDMLEAEEARILGRADEAHVAYDRAAELAETHGYLQDLALIHERAALFFKKRNMGGKFRHHVREAYNVYRRWGATVKCGQLAGDFPDAVSRNENNENRNVDKASGTLDMASVLSASQAMAQSVRLQGLLTTMMRIIIETAGAEKGCMILKNGNALFVEAEINTGEHKDPVLRSIDINDYGGLSHAVVNYVARTRETVLLNDAVREGDFVNDPYVKQELSRSILCLPLIHQNRLSAILYLENNQSAGVFTGERVTILNMLSSQMAISIANARLYEHLEDMVGQRTEALNQSLKEVKSANAMIMSSLVYASMMQASLLPSRDLFQRALPESFVIWKPRDIVSGDMYHLEDLGDHVILSVVDCTGHGVPGALMTMIAGSGLRMIITGERESDPARILSKLNRFVKSSLKHDKGNTATDDGMDAAVCCLSKATGFMTFAGARLPLYIAENQTVRVIKGDRHSIGYMSSDSDYPFTVHTVEKVRDATFYLATDGFIDQLGGDPRQRFGSSRFKTLLSEICHAPFEEQKIRLLTDLARHRGRHESIDDVTVIGFRVTF